MLNKSEEENLRDILKFYVNNPSLDKLTSKINEFNPIKILGRHEFEIKHSNVLAWLLNPNGHHGLQDGVFKRIVSEILKENNLDRMDFCFKCVSLFTLN